MLRGGFHMKHIAILFSITILCFSLSALAHDFTRLGSVKPQHATVFPSVELPEGKSLTEVWATNNEKISCRFISETTAEVVYKADDTQRCVGTANLVFPAHIHIIIINKGDKQIDVRAWIHSTK